MGKDLKGKELGRGISQRKDGLYTARFTNKAGKRVQKYFKKLQDCRSWIAEAQYQDQYNNMVYLKDISVDAWFQYWLEEVKKPTIRDGTLKDYLCIYNKHISPVIGTLLVTEVQPIHCQTVLNQMAKKGLKNNTIHSARTKLYTMFAYAVENQIIIHNPVTKSIKWQIGASTKERTALTKEEQQRFLRAAHTIKNHSLYENQFELLLQTGLRSGELIALTWSDINFSSRTIYVNKTIKSVAPNSQWVITEPKTKAGIREIPLTEQAYKILLDQKEKQKSRKIIPIEFANYVFLSEAGVPITNTTYDAVILRICKRAKLPPISMHILRHTFATRCIEGGMKPKTLQKILGHSSLKVTMDIYVHVTADEIKKEMLSLEASLNVV